VIAIRAALLGLLLSPPQDPPAFGVWDTLRTPAGSGDRSGWTRLSAVAPLQGDAVVTTGRVTAVFRRNGRGVELHSPSALRATLLPVGGGAVERIALVEVTRTMAVVEVGWKSAALRFRLRRGDVSVEAEALTAGASLRVECPGRYAVLPDFFADDILVDARRVAQDRVELPSENFVLHFAGKGDAIVMAVFQNRDQEVRATIEGAGEGRAMTGSEIEFGKGGKVWVAALEAPGIWHARELAAEDAKKILPLDWKMPFTAQWRVDFTRKGELTDSWDMLLQFQEGAEYVKPSWLAADGKISEASRTASGEVDRDAYKPGGPASDRVGLDRKRWTTVLGQVLYPCWSDPEGKGYLQPLAHKRVEFRGPVVVYPINRLERTPPESFTPVDVVRNTLGVGPCQYILDVEGQKQEHVGRATCHVRTLLNEMYTRGEQKSRRREIETYLGDALDFVAHIRRRILAYVEFGRELRKYLEERRKAQPEFAAALEGLEALLREIDERVEAKEKAMWAGRGVPQVAERLAERTTPACVAELNRVFLATLAGYEGADWKERIKKEYTDTLTWIGGNQDEMVGECRWVVKAARQKAALLAGSDARLAPVAAEVRARCQKMLRGGAAYEGGRH
jgi:hypothetical protein